MKHHAPYAFHFLVIAFGIVLFSACASNTLLHDDSSQDLRRKWEELNLDARYHVGLSIYDATASKTLFGYRDDNYFTPASNIKILTMYASLQLLGEQLVAAYYNVNDDSMFVWGGGDPGTNYPHVDDDGDLVTFLSKTDKRIFFSKAHFQTTRYGKGWAWDDFPYSFQAERNAYPIYGNELWVRREKDRLIVKPAYLGPFIQVQKGAKSRFTRRENGEAFDYIIGPEADTAIVHAPISFLKNDIVRIWSEASGKNISFTHKPFDPDANVVAGSSRDSLIKFMMQESDNFIAEQLLLACSMTKLGYMNEEAIIDDVRHTLLAQVDDYVQWVDGSGLSRYNLVTPRSLVDVLYKIHALKGLPYIKAVFPAGGKSGTIKDWYGADRGEPFVYAKSGSLRNQHCLSGYLVTRRGHVLIFSFMHNQVVEDPVTIRRSMENLFDFLYDKY